MEKCCVNGETEYRKLQELSEFLKIVADTNRLQILCLLKNGERCVCNIYEPLGLPQNLVSHHLKALRDAGLVVARREGKWMHYSVNRDKLAYLTGVYGEILLSGSQMESSESSDRNTCG